MIVNDSTRFPSGLRHTSHSPAKAKGSSALQMNPHRHLALAFLAPFIEAVSRDNATASIYEKLEGRQLRQRFSSRVYHPIADGRVCRPNAESAPNA